ncbi:MAG: NAD(P)H-dependent glycerol-3-phosphate dehydrogenase [Hyphomicrobiales bacterium]
MSYVQSAQHIVIGAGAWGTALAIMLARDGQPVHLVTRSDEKAQQINAVRKNVSALPSIRLPESLLAYSVAQESALQDSLTRAPEAVVLLAMPAQATRQAVRDLAPLLSSGHRLVITAKGLERGTQQMMSTVVAQEASGQTVGVLSGPSFAHDVAKGLPTAVTLAAPSIEMAQALCVDLQGSNFRPYASDDLIGVQLGGALKNVLAIAAGVVEGKGLGESAKAALITRGFAELSRLAISQGAHAETLVGLSGLGDLVLTCSTAGSRNFAFGHSLGQGNKPDDLLQNGQPLAEGAKTAAAALDLGRANNIDMPITQTVADIVEGDMSVDQAIAALMARPLKREH